MAEESKHVSEMEDWIHSGVFMILVSPSRQKFFVHKDLLLEQSRHFKRLKDEGNLPKGGICDETLMKLDDPRVFGVIAKLLYSRELEIGPTVGDEAIYVKAWQLADHFEMTYLRDKIMDMIQAYHRNWVVNAKVLNSLPETALADESPLRRYMVDQCAWDMLNNPNHFLVGVGGEMTPEEKKWFRTGGAFMIETMTRLLRYQSQETAATDPSLSVGCFYHGHEADEPCPAPEEDDDNDEDYEDDGDDEEDEGDEDDEDNQDHEDDEDCDGHNEEAEAEII